MRPVIIIPARYASTRFPGKPLADLGGKPVVLHVVEKALAVTKDVFVATDDDRILDCVYASRLGAMAVMTPSNLRSGTDRCAEGLRMAYASRMELEDPYDVVVNVQGDEPFIAPEQIESLIGCFEDPSVQIATLAKKFEKNEDIFDPNKVKVVFTEKTGALYFSRSPIPYCRGVEQGEWIANTNFYKHVGMYAYRPGVLFDIAALSQSPLEKAESLEQLRWLENGYKIAVRTTDHESIGIDTPEDLENARKALKI